MYTFVYSITEFLISYPFFINRTTSSQVKRIHLRQINKAHTHIHIAMHETSSNIKRQNTCLLSRALPLLTFNSIIKRKLIFLEIINYIDDIMYGQRKITLTVSCHTCVYTIPLSVSIHTIILCDIKRTLLCCCLLRDILNKESIPFGLVLRIQFCDGWINVTNAICCLAFFLFNIRWIIREVNPIR